MQNSAAPRIVLASSSRYRRELLDRVLDDFETVAPNIDEAIDDGAEPEDSAARLARSKAEAVASAHHEALVIGADQIAVLDRQVLGKPGDHRTAIGQLLAASGKSMRFLTAVCVLEPENRRRYEHVDETTVRFKRFDRRLAEAYLRHDKPYDCAGSFRVESAGVVLFDSVESKDPTALIGLPMIWLSSCLLELGYLSP